MEKFNFKKKYGQNFLNNDIVLDRIIDSFSVSDTDKIIEIGPGAGALTKKLINLGCNVTAFEIDKTLKQYLEPLRCSNLDIIYRDFLDVKLSDYFSKNDTIYVVANIPYYITTPIINKFIDEDFIPASMILMVQKEVAERLTSKCRNSNYGAITVLLNYFFDIEYLFTVNRYNFYPVPNVDSAIIKFIKKETIKGINYKEFEKFVYDAFKQKRKTLKNNLKNYDLKKVEEVLNKYNLTLNNRAEDIDVEVFLDLFRFINK